MASKCDMDTAAHGQTSGSIQVSSTEEWNEIAKKVKAGMDGGDEEEAKGGGE